MSLPGAEPTNPRGEERLEGSTLEDWRGPTPQSKYRIRSQKDVLVTMRNSVRLCLDISSPDGHGQFPVLLSISTYGEEASSLLLPVIPRKREISGCLWRVSTDPA
jgi:predicted acyl esterase